MKIPAKTKEITKKQKTSHHSPKRLGKNSHYRI